MLGDSILHLLNQQQDYQNIHSSKNIIRFKINLLVVSELETLRRTPHFLEYTIIHHYRSNLLTQFEEYRLLDNRALLNILHPNQRIEELK